MGGAHAAHSRIMKRFAFLILVPLAAIAACGGTTTNLGSDVSSAEPDGGGDASAKLEDGAPGDAGKDVQGPTEDFTCGRQMTDAGGPPYIDCEYVTSKWGRPASYCSAPNGRCHFGHCVPITVPPWNGQCAALVPVCGCDGKEYCNAEHAQASGTSVAVQGPCEVDCGPKRCNALEQYCEHGSGGAPLPDGGAFEQWDCRPFPGKCVAEDKLSCACLQAQGVSFGSCTGQPGHVRTEQFFP